jgi:hypothetical protein
MVKLTTDPALYTRFLESFLSALRGFGIKGRKREQRIANLFCSGGEASPMRNSCRV